MKRFFVSAYVFFASVSLPVYSANDARADVKIAAVREAVEFVMKKFGKEAAEEGTEALTQRLGALAAKHGDEALEAVRNVGPKALKAAEAAGDQGGTALKAMARYGDDGLEFVAKNPEGLKLASRFGDDAAEALVKNKGVGAQVIENFGEAGAKALKAVDGQSGRRLAMMAADGELKQIGRTPELLDVVGRYGNRAADFIWTHKKSLAVAAVLTAFLADPQPFIDGTKDLAGIAAETVVQPLTEGIAARTDWTLWGIVVIMAVALTSVWRSYLRHRLELKKATK